VASPPALTSANARPLKSTLALVLGSETTLGCGVGEETPGDEAVERGTTTATGFPSASTAIRTQPLPAGTLNGRRRLATFCGASNSCPGMTKLAVVGVNGFAQPTDATGTIR